MVSNQCEGKVQSLLSSMPPEDVSQLKPDLIAIKDEFDMDQHEEDEAGERVHTTAHQSCLSFRAEQSRRFHTTFSSVLFVLQKTK